MKVLKDFKTQGISKKKGEEISLSDSDALGTRIKKSLIDSGFIERTKENIKKENK